MTGYLDSSVVLRIVLRQPDRLGRSDLPELVTSGLTEVECLRALDRIRVRGLTDSERLAGLRDAVYRLLDETTVLEVTAAVLRRAGQPMPTILGSLDAIHLSSALLWAEHVGEDPVVVTHDRQLATAARASGLDTLGVEA